MASDVARLADAKMIVLGRGELLSDPLSVTPGSRYRLLLKAEIESSRRGAAVIVFNTDQPVPTDQALNWFPRYTGSVGKPFAFIADPGSDGLVTISFTAPPNVTQIVLGLRRWAIDGIVRVASTLVVEEEPEGPPCALVDNPDALRGAAFITLSRSRPDVSFGDLAVEAGARYVVSALVEDDTGRQDAALLIFTPDSPISSGEAVEAFPRFAPAVGKPFAFLDPAGGTGIVSTSFFAPAGARRIAIAAKRWANGGTVRIGSRVLAVRASVEPGRERVISLPVPSRAVELVLTPFASPFIAEPGRFDVTVTFLDDKGGAVPYAPGREDYSFSRIVVDSAAQGDSDVNLCAPEFIYVPSPARQMLVRVSGTDAHLLSAVEIGLRDIQTTLSDESAGLTRRLKSRQTGLHNSFLGLKTLRGGTARALIAENEKAMQSLRAVQSALAAEGNAAAPLRRAPAAPERPKERATVKSGGRRRGSDMRLLFVSPRKFGMLGTAATYHLVEAYARHTNICVVADSNRDNPASIVHTPPPGLDLREVAFGAPDYAARIAAIAKEYRPDIVCLGNHHYWYDIAERIREDVSRAKYVLDIKSPLVGAESSHRRKRIQDAGMQRAHLLDLVVSSQYFEDVATWLPGCTLPIRLYPLGVKVAQFSPRMRADGVIRCRRFVFIGSYARQRKIDKLLGFLAMLPEGIRTNIELDMFGSGPAEEELAKFVREKGLESVVRINHSLPQDQLFDVLPTYDAGLAWVPRESYDAAPSLKMLEYMGSGLVVVASSTTGHKRNLDAGFRGILFDEDFESFANAIQKVHLTGYQRSDLERNLELIKKRDWDKVVTGHLLPSFRDLLAAGKPAPIVATPRPRSASSLISPNSRRRLRLLMISPRPFGLLGTPGTYRLAGAYARHADVCVIANRQERDHEIVYRPANDILVHVVPFGNRHYLRTIRELAQRHDPDIVWIGNYAEWGEVAENLRQAVAGAKIVLDVKTPLLTGRDAEAQVRIRDKGKQYAGLLDLVIALNADDVETWIPGYAGPLKEYPLGVPIAAFSPRLRSGHMVRCKRFVFIGSYARARKLDVLIELIARLPAALKTEITFDMYGSGPEKGRLIELVAANDLVDVVRVNDVLPQQELFNKLSEFDAGVGWVPTELYDGSPPLKTLEYIGSGLVPIVTDTAAHRRYEREGFTLVRFTEEADSFRQAIEGARAAGFPTQRLRNNLKVLQDHDIEAVAIEHHFRAYRQLIGKESTNAAPLDGTDVAAAALDRADAAGTYNRVLLWSPDLPTKAIVAQPRARLRIACILGERLFDGLMEEAELLLLTQATWKQMLRFGRVDMVLIESTWSACTGDWYMAQLPGGEEREHLGALLAFARSLSIPTVFWMTQDHGYLHLYQDFAARFDRVFCADPRALTGLAAMGVRATLLPPAVQPRRFNPIRSIDDRTREKPGIVYDGWSDLFKFPEIRAVLCRLPTEALSVIDTNAMLARLQVGRIPERDLQPALKGWVHRGLLPEVYKRADAYLSFSQSALPPTQAAWALLEAAACRVPLLHLGALAADDFRADFVRRWRTADELVADIRAVRNDPLARELAAHQAWREAHGKHTFADRLAVICREVGLRYDWEPFPRATVVTGTMRPHLLEKSVQQYLHQTYPNKELVVVFNGGIGEVAAIRAKYRDRADIVFSALPTDRHAGSLLNFGVRQGTGQYFFRVDDDDYYGPNYIYDCMAHLRSVDADVFGKQACFLHFEGEELLYRRSRMLTQIVQFEGRDLDMGRRLFFSGCSFACKADFLKALAYPDNNNLSADTELLNRIKTMRPDAQCLKVDDLNLVVERSADVEKHTWRDQAALLKRGSKMLDKTIADVMV